MIRITAEFHPEDEERDDNHECGLTEEAYIVLLNLLSDIGLDNIQIERGD